MGLRVESLELRFKVLGVWGSESKFRRSSTNEWFSNLVWPRGLKENEGSYSGLYRGTLLPMQEYRGSCYMLEAVRQV